MIFAVEPATGIWGTGEPEIEVVQLLPEGGCPPSYQHEWRPRGPLSIGPGGGTQ